MAISLIRSGLILFLEVVCSGPKWNSDLKGIKINPMFTVPIIPPIWTSQRCAIHYQDITFL